MARKAAEGALVTEWQPQRSVQIDWDWVSELTGVDLPEWARLHMQDLADGLTARGPIVEPGKLRKLLKALNDLTDDDLEYLDEYNGTLQMLRTRLGDLVKPQPRTATPLDLAVSGIIGVYEHLGVKFTRAQPDFDDLGRLQPAIRAAWVVCKAAGVTKHMQSSPAFAVYAIRLMYPKGTS